MSGNTTTNKKAKIKLLEDSIKNSKSATQYKVNSRNKVRNILVDCSYFESKGINSPKNITFTVTIKVLRNNPKPIYWFELYGNTLNPKYNQMVRITSDYEIKLKEGDWNYSAFNNVLEVINGEFDDYTTNFIKCARKLIDGTGKITSTPKFILDAIEDINENKQEEVINVN